MSKAKGSTARRAGICAIVCVAAGSCVSAMAQMQPGGTITFIGALVAPPFSVATASASIPGTDTVASAIASSQTEASVVFTAWPSDPPSAEVSLQGARADMASENVSARFVDGRGHRIAAGPNGAFHVGASGGVMSMQSRAPSSVTLVTSYN